MIGVRVRACVCACGSIGQPCRVWWWCLAAVCV